jgi:hypothetical protein
MSRLAQMVCLVGALLASCSQRTSPPSLPKTSNQSSSYIDLEPGWRISVITPLTRSGALTLKPKGPHKLEGTGRTLTMTLEADSDLVGYERSYYRVEALRGKKGGIRIRFSEAQTVLDSKSTRAAKPSVPLFVLPSEARYVRLLYLVRSSPSDHNMAVLAARNIEGLHALTEKVQTSPVAACTHGQNQSCAWIPSGIAVRPEMRLPGSDQWIPVR